MQVTKKQFEALLSQYLSENISDTDEQLLATLLQENEAFRAYYDKMVKTRALAFTPAIELKKTSNSKKLFQIVSNTFVSEHKNSIPYLLRIAAIIIFILSTSVSTYFIVSNLSNSTVSLMSYQTIVPHGSQSKIVLPDGTVAWLNSGSTLKYNNQYGKAYREVEMTGEGYFEVQKNKDVPFIVKTNEVDVKVLGTVFNVRAYSDDDAVEVNLLEGKVDVSMASLPHDQVLTLVPNEKMVYNKLSHSMKTYKTNAARSASWTTGKLCFVDETIEDISNDLERRFDVQIYIKSQKIKNEHFSGSLDLNQPIKEILNYLDVDKKYSKTYNGKIITIAN